MKKINIKEAKFNPFTLLSDDWGLITVCSGDQENAMTISWGGFGHLWNQDVLYLFVRPQRHTYAMLDESVVAVTFLEPGHRKALGYLGSASGASEDKISQCGLHAIRDEKGLYFEESAFLFTGEILYRESLKEDAFLDPSLVKTFYEKGDFSELIVFSVKEVHVK